MPSRYLLDTNVVVHVANKATGWENIITKMETIGHGDISISAVTVWEIYRMAERAKVKKIAIKSMLSLSAMFKVIDMDGQIAALGGSLHAQLAAQGLTIGERDSMIAATAMCGHFVMVTDNVNEFSRVPGIVVENWLRA